MTAAMQAAGELLLAVAAVYPLVAIVAVWNRRRRKPRPDHVDRPGSVTVLKALCGAEPRLYENLRSFCQQDHPDFQIVFGARSPDDPALAVARRLRSEFPQLDIAVICDERVHGSNLKVSNLCNLLPHARHDILVFADSDIRVPQDYLRRVTAPLTQSLVGVVTCLYRGLAVGGGWSRLGAQFVNDWFAPSVSVVELFSSPFYAFGATIAMRRDTLDGIGGFAAVANHLADDYRLAELVRRRGLRTELCECQISSDVVEREAADLFEQELRWLRTIRALQPAGYVASVVTFTMPAAAAGLALAGAGVLSTSLFAAAVIARLLLHWQGAFWRSRPADLGLALIRDWLSLALWAVALAGRRVHWRGQRMTIDAEDPRHLVAQASP